MSVPKKSHVLGSRGGGEGGCVGATFIVGSRRIFAYGGGIKESGGGVEGSSLGILEGDWDCSGEHLRCQLI